MGYAPGEYTELRLRAANGDRVSQQQHEEHLEYNREHGAVMRDALKRRIELGDPQAIAERKRRNALDYASAKRRREVRAEDEAAKLDPQGVNKNCGAGERVGAVESSEVLRDVDWARVFEVCGRQHDTGTEYYSSEDEAEDDGGNLETGPVDGAESVGKGEGEKAAEGFVPTTGINISYPTTRFGEEMLPDDFAYRGKVYERAELKSVETVQLEILRENDKLLNSRTWQEGLARRYGYSMEDE